VPAIALGNLFAIVLASVLNGLGKKFPSLTGNGVMIPGFEYEKEDKSINYSVSKLGIGLIVVLLALTLATLISTVIPLHPFGIGITFTDLAVIMEAFTLEFVVIIGITVISVTLITAFVGKLVGIYPVEASISAGLGMMNMGGTGDVSVLAAAKRMELMAFCQI